MAVLLWLLLLRSAIGQRDPYGLMCDYQRSPALGVRAVPHFTWIVPPCEDHEKISNTADHDDQVQSAYQITVFLPAASATTHDDAGMVVWNSTKIPSNQSVAVTYNGPPLQPATHYRWTVTTWSTSTHSPNWHCQSETSQPAVFVTSLLDQGWHEQAQWMSLPRPKNQVPVTFAYFYHPLPQPFQPKAVVAATLFVTANHMATAHAADLAYYKVRVGDTLVDLGPGRGSAPVWNGDGKFRELPYATLDISRHVGNNNALDQDHDPMLLIQAMQTNHGIPADSRLGPQLLVQLVYQYANGTVETVLVSSNDDSSTSGTPWRVWNADPYHQPDCHRTRTPGTYGTGAGTQCMEQLDARFELPAANISLLPGVHTTPLADRDRFHLVPRGIPPLQVTDTIPTRNMTKINHTTWIADFGREFQGGLRLIVSEEENADHSDKHSLEPEQPTTVYMVCGEAYNATTQTITMTWGWEFTWTLRRGKQVLEQYKYMECRFVMLQFRGGGPPPTNFTIEAWKVHYPYDPNDSNFTSSNARLDQVYELCRYTLETSSLDTYTDSNTRERKPYEADGLVAATSRLVLQRDVLWARHSHAFVLEFPTWPVEWKQLAAFLGYQDYMATGGSADLTLAFVDTMYKQSMIGFLDPATGLLNTSNPDMGRHIVDWMPEAHEQDATIAYGEFTASDHHSVANAYCVRGLEFLAHVLHVGGQTHRAQQIEAQATALRAAMQQHMWNGTAFCDGICADVQGKSLVMTNMYTLAFGMIPEPCIASVYKTVTSWGLEKMGDYGAFWYQAALASSYYSPYYDTPSDGSDLFYALTKCDKSSWCWGLEHDNLTMTRESWRAGTYSHAWGASAVVGVQWGIVGIHPTSPGFETFLVKPKLGSLEHVSIKTPTIRGYIHVTAAPGKLEIIIPCNTMATLCLPRSSSVSAHADSALVGPNMELVLDERIVPSVVRGGHRCLAHPVGCHRRGAVRALRANAVTANNVEKSISEK